MPTQDAPTLSTSNLRRTTAKVEGQPALTILWHPDVARIGATFSFADVAEGESVPLSRSWPKFTIHTDAPDTLADPYLSRDPCIELVRRGDGLDMIPFAPERKFQLNGTALKEKVRLSGADLSQAAILTLARRIVLCLHKAAPPASDSSVKDDFGLVGNSDAVQAVRQSIRDAADINLPVLIRGETGTGKELTANAIVRASSRATKPFVAVNIGALPPTTAVSELLGHTRGAFTDAYESRDGLFAQADGGTLFLDEIGLASADVQTTLLRVLESGEIRPLGARSSRCVDVRVIAATDARLEQRLTAGDFSEPLFHRLSAFPIFLPSLRERREDLGLLFLHFLRPILKDLGALSRLDCAPETKHPWLSGDVATEMAMASWSGNVRQVRNVANQIAVNYRGAARARLDELLLSSLNLAVRAPEAVAAPPKACSKPANPSDISHEMLVDALERHAFRPTRTARDLGISRTTLYELISRDPELRKGADIPEDELRVLERDCKGDIAEMAKRLRVSARALQLRMRRSG
jgi:two-component system nitrogen regulation response regulator GlnG